MSNKEAMIRKFNGDEEAYRAWLKQLGSKGGKISKPPADHPTMFNNNKELASRAGKAKRKRLQ